MQDFLKIFMGLTPPPHINKLRQTPETTLQIKSETMECYDTDHLNSAVGANASSPHT